MNRIKAGVTGGIGSGKSVVCRMFEVLGYPVFHADDVSKEILDTDPEVRSRVVELFGEQAYLPVTAGRVADRAFLAGAAFSDPGRLEELNNILHPAVKQRFRTWEAKQETLLVFQEAAILFESGSYRYVDLIIGVRAPLELRISRVINRDGKTREEVLAIMQRQMPQEELVARCDYVVDNDEEGLVIPQVLRILDQITNRTHGT